MESLSRTSSLCQSNRRVGVEYIGERKTKCGFEILGDDEIRDTFGGILAVGHIVQSNIPILLHSRFHSYPIHLSMFPFQGEFANRGL